MVAMGVVVWLEVGNGGWVLKTMVEVGIVSVKKWKNDAVVGYTAYADKLMVFI